MSVYQKQKLVELCHHFFCSRFLSFGWVAIRGRTLFELEKREGWCNRWKWWLTINLWWRVVEIPKIHSQFQLMYIKVLTQVWGYRDTTLSIPAPRLLWNFQDLIFSDELLQFCFCVLVVSSIRILHKGFSSSRILQKDHVFLSFKIFRNNF